MWFDIIKLDREYLRSLREKGYDVTEEMLAPPVYTEENIRNVILDWAKHDKSSLDLEEVKVNRVGDRRASAAAGYAIKFLTKESLIFRYIKEVSDSDNETHYYSTPNEIAAGHYVILLFYPTKSKPAFKIIVRPEMLNGKGESLKQYLERALPYSERQVTGRSELRAGKLYNQMVEGLGGEVLQNGDTVITGDSGNRYRFNFENDCNVYFSKAIDKEHLKSLTSHEFHHEQIDALPDYTNTITMCIHASPNLRGLPLGDKLTSMLMALKNDTADSVPAPIRAAATPFGHSGYSHNFGLLLDRLGRRSSKHITQGSAQSYLAGGTTPW